MDVFDNGAFSEKRDTSACSGLQRAAVPNGQAHHRSTPIGVLWPCDESIHRLASNENLLILLIPKGSFLFTYPIRCVCVCSLRPIPRLPLINCVYTFNAQRKGFRWSNLEDAIITFLWCDKWSDKQGHGTPTVHRLVTVFTIHPRSAQPYRNGCVQCANKQPNHRS